MLLRCDCYCLLLLVLTRGGKTLKPRVSQTFAFATYEFTHSIVLHSALVAVMLFLLDILSGCTARVFVLQLFFCRFRRTASYDQVSKVAQTTVTEISLKVR